MGTTLQTPPQPRVIHTAQLIAAMLKSHGHVSDLIFSPGRPPQVEVSGQLVGLTFKGLECLTASDTKSIAYDIMGENEHPLRKLDQEGSADLSYGLSGVARFRVNIFRQRGSCAIVMRVIPDKIPGFNDLRLPVVLSEVVQLKNGIVLVTGPTGSGKSSTLAAIIDKMNAEKAFHILTIEDPIEFLHRHKKATIHQRELHSDTPTFALALRAALRQPPKVILVGEMRDRATIEIALMASETGHLVLSTLHTVDAGQSINRVLGLFSLGEEQQLRIRLADSLRYIVSQRLAPKMGGGRQLLTEIMGNNLRTRETIAIGEGEHRSFYEIIEASEPFGWVTFDQSLLNAYEKDMISEETARLFASRKSRVGRGIDLIQKARGVDNDLDSGLRLDLPENAFR